MNYCSQENIQCEYCNSNGFCMITGCAKKSIQISTKYDPMNFRVVNLVELTDECIDRIADAVVRRMRKNERNH